MDFVAALILTFIFLVIVGIIKKVSGDNTPNDFSSPKGGVNENDFFTDPTWKSSSSNIWN